MKTNAKIYPDQWRAVEVAQVQHGVHDKIVAKMLGCGQTTVRTNRTKGGWTVRILPDGFMTPEMLRQSGAIDPEDFNLFGETALQPALDEAALRRAHERLLAADRQRNGEGRPE